MFAVPIEAQPHKERWDDYLARANIVCAGLEQAPGFIDLCRYKSLTREGWILSLSGWRDETSALGWLVRMGDDLARGWSELLAGYRLRIGEVTSDTNIPEGEKIAGQGLERPIGEGTYMTLVQARKALDPAASNPQELALYLGFDPYSYGDCLSWDVFEDLSGQGEIILAVTWKDAQSANSHAATQIVPDEARVRVVRVVRDDIVCDPRNARLDRPDAGPQDERSVLTDEFQLQRFVDAQHDVYRDAVHAIRNRILDPAWMAFVFPRFVECYHDSVTSAFAIASLDEARAYLAHRLLGGRLRESLGALEWMWDLDVDAVLADRDKKNLHSSLTLFAEATSEPLMQQMLSIWFGSRADEVTMVQLDLRP